MKPYLRRAQIIHNCLLTPSMETRFSSLQYMPKSFYMHRPSIIFISVHFHAY